MEIFLNIVCCIIPCILATCILGVIDKFKIKDMIVLKVTTFDKKNKGPIYDFFKTIFLCIVILVAAYACILSLAFVPYMFTLYSAFLKEGIVSALKALLLATIICTIGFSFIRSDG